jgi:tetratricopeptide (TPR) repeat protein
MIVSHTYYKKLNIIFLLLVIILVQFVFAQELADVILWSPDGKSTKEDAGEIVKETFEGVDLKIKGSAAVIKIKLAQIRNITYRGEHPLFTQARQSQEAGKYTQAIDIYNKLLSDANLRSIFRQHLLYNIALSYQLAGQIDKAIESYDNLFKEFSDTRYFRQAYFNKSGCFNTKKDIKMATDTLDEAKAKGQKLGDKFLFEVDLRKATLLEENNQLDNARGLYNRLTAIAIREPTILYRAKAGLGRIHILNKNFTEAEGIFKEVIEKREADDIAKAVAYNGRADCIIARNPSPDLKTYKAALFDYLISKVLYAAPPGESTQEEEKAIYNSAYCYEKLAQAMPPEKKKVYINNAIALYRELKQKFPASKLVPDANKRSSELK